MAKFSIRSTAEYVSYSKLVEQAIAEAITEAHEMVAVDAIEKSRRSMGSGANGSKMPPREPGMAPRRRVSKTAFGLHSQKYYWRGNKLYAGPMMKNTKDLPFMMERGGRSNIKTFVDLRYRHRDGSMRGTVPRKLRAQASKEWNKKNAKNVHKTGFRHAYRRPRQSYYHQVTTGTTIKPRPVFTPHAKKAFQKHQRFLNNAMRKRFKKDRIPYKVGFRIARNKGFNF